MCARVSCTSCNLLGRVSHPRNSRHDKDIRLVEGLQGGAALRWRAFCAGLRSRSGRSWTRPTGAQDLSRQARRCHRRAMTERASSKFRRAKPRGIFLSYPATGRKNRGFAGVKFLQTKIPAGEAQRDFLVSPGLTSQVSLRSTCSKAERAELTLCPFRLKKEIYEKETCTRVSWKSRSSRRGPG